MYASNTLLTRMNAGFPGVLRSDYLMFALKTSDAPGQTLRVVLMPVSDTQARALGPLAQGGETVRVVMVDGVEQLAYSGYLAKKTVASAQSN